MLKKGYTRMKNGFVDTVEKLIETRPIEITSEHLGKGSTINYLDDEKIILKQFIWSYIEFALGLLCIGLYLFAIVKDHNEIIARVEKTKSECLGTIPKYIKIYYNNGKTDIIRNTNKKVEFTYEADKFMELGEEKYYAVVAKNVRQSLSLQIFVAIGMISVGGICIFNGWPRTKKFIFNRKKGTFTFPEFLGFRQCTIPFNEAVFVYGKLWITEAGAHLAVLHPSGISKSVIDFFSPTAFLSLYVWYMDKNRPLPPGNAFDPYREKDFLRRYSEGFPAPLYPSTIATPEFEFKGSLPTERSYFVSDEAYQRIIGKKQKKRNDETKNKAKKPKSEAQKRIDAYNAYRDKNK